MSGGTGTPGFGSLLSGSGATPYNPQAGTPSTGGAGQPAGGLMGAMGGKGGQGGQQAQIMPAGPGFTPIGSQGKNYPGNSNEAQPFMPGEGGQGVPQQQQSYSARARELMMNGDPTAAMRMLKSGTGMQDTSLSSQDALNYLKQSGDQSGAQNMLRSSVGLPYQNDQITNYPQQPQYAPLAPQGQFNVNQASAGALQQAMQGTQAGMGFQPERVQPTSYQAERSQASGYMPSSMNSQGYNAQNAGSQGYNAQNAGSQGYDAQGYSAEKAGSQGFTAADVESRGYDASQVGPAPVVTAQSVQAGQLAGKDLGAYANKYENQVVQQTLSDLARNRDMTLNQQGAQATAANAFGGSRQAIADSETQRAFAEQSARAASGLRQAGFTQAQQMAQQDIGTAQQAALANQQANLQADTTTGQFGQQSSLANQSALNQAGQFGAAAFNQAAGQRSAQQQAASQFGASAANQASLANAAAANQAAQFSAGAQNQASQFGSAAANQAGLTNAAAQNQASQFGSAAANQAALTNAAAQNTAGQFGSAAANQAAAANMAAQNQAAQFGAGASNQMSLANQTAGNQANQFAASQGMAAQLANQSAGLQGNQQRLGAASQLGGLGQQAFNTGQTIQQNQMQQGLLQQGLQQQLINAAKQQYGGFTGAPMQSLSAPLAALGQTPNQSTTTNSQNPGLLSYLQTIGMMCWVAREVYGEDNPKWLQFREWVIGYSPNWFYKAYSKYGEKMAAVVAKVPALKFVIRPFMDAKRKAMGYK